MPTTPLETIIDLQKTLDRLERAVEQIEGIPDWMQELDAEHRVRRDEIAALEATAEEAAVERRAAEAGIADTQEKLRRYQGQINAVTNQREYGALLQEIDTAKQQVAALEEQGLAALERADSSRQDIEAKREEFRELDERYKSELERWDSEKPVLAAEAEELRKHIEELHSQLPRAPLAQFERIRERMGGRALAAVRKIERSGRGGHVYACGGCNFNVRPQILVEIRNRGAIIQCDSCKRILYEEPQPAAGGDGDAEAVAAAEG